MNISQLKYFIQIVNSGSLSKASEVLDVSQPALTKYISNLEHSLKVKLFVSERRIMTPTPAGKIYYDMATKIVNVQKQTEQRIDMILDRSVETIRVGASPHRGGKLIAKVYKKFSLRYPHVLLDITECYQKEGVDLLKANQIDLLLGATESKVDGELSKVIMYSEEVFVVVPVSHPLAQKARQENKELPPINPSLLANDPWIFISEGATLHSITQKLCIEYKFSPTIVFSNKNILVVDTVLKQGSGVGLALNSYVDKNQDDVVYFPIENKKYLYTCAFFEKNRTLSEAERYLIGLLIEADIDTPTLTADRNQLADEIYEQFLKEQITL